jgi:hypothetical protein
MSTSLSPSSRLKLARVLNLLTSPVDGEALATAHAAHRLLKDAGLYSFEQVIGAAPPAPASPAPPSRVAPAVRGILARLDEVSDELTDWEFSFVDSLRYQVAHGQVLTAKQLGKLEQIARARL